MAKTDVLVRMKADTKEYDANIQKARKQLEDELGCLLFERVNHSITLTEDGKKLLSYAQNMHRLTKEFHQSFSSGKETSSMSAPRALSLSTKFS